MVGQKQDSKELAQEWKQRIAQTAQPLRQKGTLPGSFEQFVNDIVQPNVDWRRVLSEFVVKRFKNGFRWTPPSRRHLHAGIVLPSLRSEGLGNIAVLVDTSGSISDKELDLFISEVQAILNTYDMNLHLIQHDSIVQKCDSFKRGDKIKGIKIKGRGGTDHRPAFAHLDKNNIEPICIISLTDAFTDWPEEEPQAPTLIVTTPDHGCLPGWPHLHLVMNE